MPIACFSAVFLEPLNRHIQIKYPKLIRSNELTLIAALFLVART